MSEQHSGLLSGWWTALIQLRQVSAERRQQVLRDIHEGSIPSATYYSLLGISEVIAGFALMIDSDATLIGANVVAPLMTPIIGMSLGLLRGDVGLLYRAVLAEFGGALFGVMLCFALGRLPLMDEPTALLLSQTKPTLIDLFVASLAGFAGVLAMIDERVSPALPGVAAVAFALVCNWNVDSGSVKPLTSTCTGVSSPRTRTDAGSTPISSAASRSAASTSVSPGSVAPPGRLIWPACRARPQCLTVSGTAGHDDMYLASANGVLTSTLNGQVLSFNAWAARSL